MEKLQALQENMSRFSAKELGCFHVCSINTLTYSEYCESKNNLAHYEVGSSSIRNRSVCRWNKRENFPAPLQEILTGFLVVLYVVVVVCVDNARPLFFAKSFYKLHHRRHTDTAASKLSTSSKQVINNNEIGKNNIWCCFTTFFILGVGMPSE